MLEILRFLSSFPSFARPWTDEAAAARLRDDQRCRGSSFCAWIERAVFDRPTTPYARLFHWAGIEAGDVRKLVERDGVESALEALRDAGVWLSLDEFKGRRPIRRKDLEIAVGAGSFDNPMARYHWRASTGGSGGPAQRVGIDLDNWVHDAAAHRFYAKAHSVLDRDVCVWRPFAPGGAGFERVFLHLKNGRPPRRWLSQAPPVQLPAGLPYLGLWAYVMLASGLRGRALPWPRHVGLDHPEVAARWLAKCTASATPGYLDTLVGAGVRVAEAATGLGLDISGSFLRVGSEALTPARAKVLEAAGCRVACHYAMTETGTIGFACARGESCDDVHVMTSKLALLAHPRPDLDGDGRADLYLTMLHPSSSKVMINVETGDAARMRQRTCGCALGEMGFDLHLEEIRSVEKLTSEGAHFLGSDLLQLVEEVLPAAYGGAPTDYQWVEDDTHRLPRVELRVAPEVGTVDEEAVRRTALEFLSSRGPGEAMMAGLWTEGRTLVVSRQRPLATSAAKIPPIARR